MVKNLNRIECLYYIVSIVAHIATFIHYVR